MRLGLDTPRPAGAPVPEQEVPHVALGHAAQGEGHMSIFSPGARVKVHPGWDCPGNLSVHGTPEGIDDADGIVLGVSPPMPPGVPGYPRLPDHPIKVGLQWGFSYFTEAELEIMPRPVKG